MREQALSALAEEEIKKIIFFGELPENGHLNIDNIARACNCSKTPVREALQRLAADGLVIYSPNIGYKVKQISLPEYWKIYEFQEIIEVYLVGKAAEMYTHIDFDRLEAVNRNIEVLIKEKKNTFYGRANDVFHEVLYKEYPNDYLLQEMKKIWGKARIYRNKMFIYPCFMDNIVKEHNDIIESLRRGDKDAASAAMRRHYASGREAILYSCK